MKTRPKIVLGTRPLKTVRNGKQKAKTQVKSKSAEKSAAKRVPKHTEKAIKKLVEESEKEDSEEEEETPEEINETTNELTQSTEDESQEATDKANARITVPDVLHTEDGATFYPCKNCCRAFAKRADLHKHQIFCRSSGIKHAAPAATTSSLPLTSVENTMNSPKASEMNNNRNSDTAPLELSYTMLESKLKSPNAFLQKPYEKTVKLDMIANSIHSFDVKNKLNICKALNTILENNGFSMTVMGSGEIVLKMHSPDYPPLEFITKVVLDQETHTEKILLTLKPLKERGVKNKDLEWEMPEIVDVLEATFGPDAIFSSLQNDQDVKASTSDEIMLQIDEEHFPTDDQVMSMAGMDGTIVLEDLDIHICKQCGAVYHTLRDLIAHDKYDHRKLKRKYSLEELDKFAQVFKADAAKKCPICDMKLKGNGEWPRHAQSHCEIGMFVCTVCKMRFTRDDHRKNHESRHIIKK